MNASEKTINLFTVVGQLYVNNMVLQEENAAMKKHLQEHNKTKTDQEKNNES